MQIEQLHRYLDRPAEAEGWLRTWGLENTARAHGNLVRMAAAGVTLDLLADLRSACRAPAAAQRPGHGAQQPGAVRRRPPATRCRWLAVRARPRGAADPAADLLDQPAPERPADHRHRELRPAADDRRRSRWPARRWSTSWSAEVAALADERAVMAALRRFKRRETLRICLRRHHPRAAHRDRDAADFVPGRRHSRSGRARRAAQAASRSAACRARATAGRRGSSCWRWASSAAAS